jgi:hypothetical protein
MEKETMRATLRCLAIVGSIGLTSAASAGTWKYGEDPRGNSELTYTEDGKAKFYIGCGRAFGLHVKYPGTAKKSGKASITIATAKAKMNFDGEFEEPSADLPTTFLQWDLGFRRQDPELFGKRWKAVEKRLFDLLESGEPVTISAGGNSYQLPPNDAQGWRAPFDGCG